MALRNFASPFISSLGLRAQVGTTDLFNAAGLIATRAYATVMQGYKYAPSHEWAKAEGDVASVGISDHAQAELGDVVYVELPEVGRQVKKGETFGVVESVKAASDVYSPVSGEVVEVNSTLADKPGTVNTACYTDGWMIKVKLSSKDELSQLLDAKAYEAECEKH